MTKTDMDETPKTRLGGRLVIGSRSEHKVGAARDALAALGYEMEVVGQTAKSQMPEQPYGDAEIVFGALARALEMREANPGDFVAAAENGVAERDAAADPDEGLVDLGYIVAIAPSGEIRVWHSDAVPVPAELVTLSRASAWTTTCGKLEAARSGCDHADPHILWGGVHRRAILAEAFQDALAGILPCRHDAPGPVLAALAIREATAAVAAAKAMRPRRVGGL